MGSMPMYVPDFKNVVMPAIVAALDEWKVEADKSECRGRVEAVRQSGNILHFTLHCVGGGGRNRRTGGRSRGRCAHTHAAGSRCLSPSQLQIQNPVAVV